MIKKLCRHILKEEIQDILKQKDRSLESLEEKIVSEKVYKDLVESIEEIKKHGFKFQKVAATTIISSHINEEKFKELFSGSITYLETNGISGFSKDKLDVYLIATHKIMQEYIGFVQYITPCKLEQTTAYKNYLKIKDQK